MNNMTKNSLICNFINSHPYNWRDLLKEKNINVKDTDIYSIFVYRIEVDFKDPLVQEARGIIIDTKNLEVVCWPFRKFGKYTENYADEIDWKTARVQEKIDGSIIKLWYSTYFDRWIWSTNSMIYAEDALIVNGFRSFMDIIKTTKTYNVIEDKIKDSERDVLNKDYTYIFELTTNDNQVVIKYGTNEMYHIGTRNNKTGEELLPEDTLTVEMLGYQIPRPFIYNLSSLEECVYFVENELNVKEEGRISTCTDEGFVVVDANWNRIKVKSPIYRILHNIVTNGESSKKFLIELLHKDLIDVESISREFNDKAHWIKYYSYKYTEVVKEITAFVSITRKIYELTNGDRKFVAKKICNHKYSPIAFRAIGNYKTIFELMDEMTGGIIKQLCSFIPDYKPANYSYLFDELKEYQSKS